MRRVKWYGGRPRRVPGYDAISAGKRALRLRRRACHARKLRPHTALWSRTIELLGRRWLPQQIATILKHEQLARADMQASHETICTAIYACPKGELCKGLTSLLHRAHGARRPHSRNAEQRGKFADMLSIHLRPPEVNDRLVPGHWESDLIKGARNQSCAGTLVCRRTCFMMIVKDDGVKALQADGREHGADHHFADPHSPWQRGAQREHQWTDEAVPKGTDLSVYSQRRLDAIAWKLNTRARNTLD